MVEVPSPRKNGLSRGKTIPDCNVSTYGWEGAALPQIWGKWCAPLPCTTRSSGMLIVFELRCRRRYSDRSAEACRCRIPSVAAPTQTPLTRLMSASLSLCRRTGGAVSTGSHIFPACSTTTFWPHLLEVVLLGIVQREFERGFALSSPSSYSADPSRRELVPANVRFRRRGTHARFHHHDLRSGFLSVQVGPTFQLHVLRVGDSSSMPVRVHLDRPMLSSPVHWAAKMSRVFFALHAVIT